MPVQGLLTEGCIGPSRAKLLSYIGWLGCLCRPCGTQVCRYVGYTAPQGTPWKLQVGEIWCLEAIMLALWLRSLHLGGSKQ